MAPVIGRLVVKYVTPSQTIAKNTGIESTEKVKKKRKKKRRYVMERMTSGLIRCLGKSFVKPRWSSGSQKAKMMRQCGFGHFS